jgi:hypothetical protein
MSSMSMSSKLALVSILVVASLGAVGMTLEPENATRWIFRMLMLPALWGFLEVMQHRGNDSGGSGNEIMKWHRLVIAWVGLMTTMDLGRELLVSTDILDADWAPIGQSIQGVLYGAGLTVWGNLLPTIPSPWSSEDQPFAWQRVHRFVGWVATLCGIALVVVWMFLSVSDARLASAGILGVFLVLSLGRKLVSVLAHSANEPALQ